MAGQGLSLFRVNEMFMTHTNPDRLIRFAREYIRSPATVGSLVPSSSILAEKITAAALRYGAEDALVIEAGSGCGAITATLAASLHPAQRLIACEYNAGFAATLRQRLPDVAIRNCLVQDLPQWQEEGAKIIVSSLPFRSLPKRNAREIVACFRRALRRNPGSVLVQFSYGLRNPIPELAAERCIRCFCQQTVWRNVPPARVWVYRRRNGIAADAWQETADRHG